MLPRTATGIAEPGQYTHPAAAARLLAANCEVAIRRSVSGVRAGAIVAARRPAPHRRCPTREEPEHQRGRSAARGSDHDLAARSRRGSRLASGLDLPVVA